jgi:hypothetical protein
MKLFASAMPRFCAAFCLAEFSEHECKTDVAASADINRRRFIMDDMKIGYFFDM